MLGPLIFLAILVAVIAGWWKVPTRSELTGIRKDLVRFEKLRRTFAKAALLLSEAARLSRPPGRPVVHALARQAEFADHWMAGRIAMRRSSGGPASSWIISWSPPEFPGSSPSNTGGSSPRSISA